MVDHPITLTLASIHQNHRDPDPRAWSHRISDSQDRKTHSHRCKSQERFRFDHNHFTHAKIIKASHDIPIVEVAHEHKHNLHEDHSRVITIKKRVVSENILLDSFPSP
jgi:hypothetical protein